MHDIKVGLNETQRKKLQKAILEGKDFSAKLTHSNLEGDDLIKTGKVLYNKIGKNKIAGKGMVIKLSSNQVAQLKDKVQKIDKKVSKKGGAITTAAAIASLGMANEFLNDYPQVKNFLGSITEDIVYLFSNPMAISYRFIVAVKIPNMNKRYRDIVISIDRLKKIIPSLTKPAVKREERKIINLETLRDRVGNHIQTLIERLPIIKEMAEERNETLKARQAKQLETQIEKTENKLESLTEKKGEGLQVDGYGLQVDARGSGVIMDKIKSQIKTKHIDPLKNQMKNELQKEKKKMKDEFNKEISIQKNKILKMGQEKMDKEISKVSNFGYGLQVDRAGRGSKKK